MAVSPILLNKLPFDAEKEHTLQFTYSGSQIFAHRVIVKNNITNEEVYNHKESSMNTIATIPANTLVNGNTYNFQISVFDHEDVESPLSNVVILKCFKTPSFGFSNVTDGMIVRNSYLDVEISYEQESGELLNGYRVMLYAVNQTTLVYNSGTKYSGDLTVRIPELMDDTTYYLRATGETVNGMEMDTGLFEIVCDYLKPDVFLKFRADNIPEEGCVRLSTNFVLIEGSSNTENLIYIDDEKISLLNGEKVFFDKGYSASNFTVDIILESIPDFANIISFNMKSAMANVTWNYGTFEEDDSPTYYAELTAYQYIGTKRLNYIQMSNRIEPLEDGDQAHIWIQHVDGLFDIKIAKHIPLEALEIIDETVDEITEEGSEVA